MTDHHRQLVQRVIHALEEDRDPDALVWAYFDQDRDAVVQAAMQTLEATRENADPVKVSRTLDKELIEGLRFPSPPPGGILPTLYVRRRAVGYLGAILAMVATAVLFLL